VFAARYELNSYIVFRKRLVSKRLRKGTEKIEDSGLNCSRNYNNLIFILYFLFVAVTPKYSHFVAFFRRFAGYFCNTIYPSNSAQKFLSFFSIKILTSHY
jgi:hypothetical protein